MGAVATQETPAEADADLLHGSVGRVKSRGGDGHRIDQVLSRVGSGHGEWQLGPREDDGFAKTDQHQGQGGRRVRQCIRPVNDDEGVVLIALLEERRTRRRRRRRRRRRILVLRIES